MNFADGSDSQQYSQTCKVLLQNFNYYIMYSSRPFDWKGNIKETPMF